MFFSQVKWKSKFYLIKGAINLFLIKKKIPENSLFSDISAIVIFILTTICTNALSALCILIIKNYSIVIPFGKAPDAILVDLFSNIILVKLEQ